MKTPAKIVIVLMVAAAAVAAAALRGTKAPAPSASTESAAPTTNVAAAGETAATPVNAKLPRLLDLGAGKCIPCKMMAPILENLRKEYSGRMIVEFIDVWENRDAGGQYGIEAIPTQIFFDAEGKELFRHQGFYSKEDILGKWKELGITFPASAKS